MIDCKHEFHETRIYDDWDLNKYCTKCGMAQPKPALTVPVTIEQLDGVLKNSGNVLGLNEDGTPKLIWILCPTFRLDNELIRPENN